MKGFVITINSAAVAQKIRRGTAGKGKGGSFAFQDKSKYCRKQKHKKVFDQSVKAAIFFASENAKDQAQPENHN